MKGGKGAMFANAQGIKNLMSQYDKDGDYIDPTTGLFPYCIPYYHKKTTVFDKKFAGFFLCGNKI